jgi:hypothetical protein
MSANRTTLVLFCLALASPLSAQGCLTNAARSGKDGDHQNISRTDQDRRSITVRWRRGDCEIRIDARGDFAVKPDLSGFVGVEDGGWIDVQERDGDVERRVRIVGTGRDLEYRWTVDGRNGFDVNRERWLADILVALERRTAMFAKWRVPELVKNGGPNAVLDETDRMASDYARRTYFSHLLNIARLPDPTLERMLRQTELMSSDYERAEVLRAVSSKQGPVSDRAARAMIAVAQRMSSDYEKRRALAAGLESVSTLEARTALFSAAATMSSSYELAEFLIAAQRRSLVDSLSSDSYFRAVGKLSSDYERRRTLSALMKLRPNSPAVLAGVLRSSEFISSDYELASLLVEFAKTVPVRGELREQYLKATRTISSDYEYRRALQALLEQDRHS